MVVYLYSERVNNNEDEMGENIENQIKLAESLKAKHNGYPIAYVTESKLSKRSKRLFYGFFFSKEIIALGSVIENHDGSISKVVAFVA